MDNLKEKELIEEFNFFRGNKIKSKRSDLILFIFFVIEPFLLIGGAGAALIVYHNNTTNGVKITLGNALLVDETIIIDQSSLNNQNKNLNKTKINE